MKAGRPSLGTLALITTAALWGSNHVVARAAREAIPLPSLVFWRWLPAVILLTLVALPTHAPRRGRRSARGLGELIVGGVVGVGLFSYLLLGGAYQSLAIEVGFINATTPVWVLLLGLWMGGGKLTAGMKWGLALAFAGTLLIITKGHIEALTALQFSLGNLWSLLAAMAFAWFSIRVRDWSRTIAPLALTVVTAWSGLIVVMLPVYVVWIVLGGPWLVWNAADTGFALATIAYHRARSDDAGKSVLSLRRRTNRPGARSGIPLSQPACFPRRSRSAWLGEELAWYHVAGFSAILSGLIFLGYPNQRASAG